MPSTNTEADRIRTLDWPLWPWLPLKRGEQTGVIYADDVDLPSDPEANGPVRVFDANVYGFDRMGVDVKMSLAGVGADERALNGSPEPFPVHSSYDTVEAMLADGWRVD